MSFGYSERRRLLDRALADLEDVLHGAVIEVGAGRAGRRGRFVPPRTGAAWFCVDLAVHVRPHVAADAEALPFRDGSAETVISLEMLEYTTRPVVALAEMQRVLRRGGHLLLSVPFVHRADTPTDRWRFTERGLRDALVAARFDVVEVRAQGDLFTAVAHLVWSALAQHARPTRWALGLLAVPLLVLAKIERFLVRRGGPFATASTGYVAVARKA